MNSERFAAFWLQLSGKIKQALGALTGNRLLEAAGRRDRIIGKARQVSVGEQQAAARQLKDFQHHHRNWNF